MPTLNELKHEELVAELERYDEVARKHGFSEEVNCLPWTFLDMEFDHLFQRVQRMIEREARVREALGKWKLRGLLTPEGALIVADLERALNGK